MLGFGYAKPPATRTRPSLRRTAWCLARATFKAPRGRPRAASGIEQVHLSQRPLRRAATDDEDLASVLKRGHRMTGSWPGRHGSGREPARRAAVPHLDVGAQAARRPVVRGISAGERVHHRSRPAAADDELPRRESGRVEIAHDPQAGGQRDGVARGDIAAGLVEVAVRPSSEEPSNEEDAPASRVRDRPDVITSRKDLAKHGPIARRWIVHVHFGRMLRAPAVHEATARDVPAAVDRGGGVAPARGGHRRHELPPLRGGDGRVEDNHRPEQKRAAPDQAPAHLVVLHRRPSAALSAFELTAAGQKLHSRAAQAGPGSKSAPRRYGQAVGLVRVAPARFCTSAFTSAAGTMNDL